MPKKKTSSKKVLNKQKNKTKKSTESSFKDRIVGFIFLCTALAVFILPQQTGSVPSAGAKEPIEINEKLLEPKDEENIPVRVILPGSDIDLSVTPSRVIDGYWELSETNASYGLGSGTPGTDSNTVIFAHAREGLFYNLKNVEKEDIIYVFTKDMWHRYKVTKITEVTPDQTEVIKPTENETLTLYTCSGFYDEKRLVIAATPVK